MKKNLKSFAELIVTPENQILPDRQMSGGPFGLTWEYDFGKYRGYTIEQVIDNDPQYVDWCQQNVVGFVLTKSARTELDLTLRIEEDPLTNDASIFDD